MGTKPNLRSKGTSKTSPVLEVVARQPRIHHPSPRASVGVREDSRISPEFRVNYRTFSVGSGVETALKMYPPNLVPMLRHTLPPNLRMTMDRIDPVRWSLAQTNLRPIRRPTRHRMRLIIRDHPEEGISLPTINLPRSSVSAEWVDMVMLEVGSLAVLGTIGLRNRNHRHQAKGWTQARGRGMDNMDTQGELQNSLTLREGSDSERVG